jgi:hypothetical protein
MNQTKLTKSVFALHRYFTWCDQMKSHFEEIALAKGKISDLFSPEGARLFMYMSYWYAGLYVVAEAWKHLKLSDPGVDLLLRERKHVELLRKYRNGVFHFQQEYLDDRFTNLMKEGMASVKWIGDLHSALSTFMLPSMVRQT